MTSQQRMLDKAKAANRESRQIEFKAEFDPSQASNWCELIKDIVSMANSGGGCILLGVQDNGNPSGWDAVKVLGIDPATITDKLAKYTGQQFSECDMTEVERDGHRVVALRVDGARIPMPFIKPGTYAIAGGKQKTAFSKGTVYFRHGAKSEPGNLNDLRRCIERELKRVRRSWLANIKKVVSAPPGIEFRVVPAEPLTTKLPGATQIRVVEHDDSAPVYGRVYADATHPHRQKEVLQLVNQRLEGRKSVNSHDILSVRRVYSVDETNPEYVYKPKFSSPQYSDAFVDWLVRRYDEDQSFFDKAREKYKALRLAVDND
jgi:hypothetical protein